jgi:transketolase
MFDQIDRQAIHSVGILGIHAEKSEYSNQSEMILGAASIVYVLWTRHLRVNPSSMSHWTNRDRFILSSRYDPAMLYSFMQLSGYRISLDDLQQSRSGGSETAGNPEFLGHGIAMGVEMAREEAGLAAAYNRDDLEIVNHFTYMLCRNSDLAGSDSQEAILLAGRLKLGKLIVLYDSSRASQKFLPW